MCYHPQRTPHRCTSPTSSLLLLLLSSLLLLLAALILRYVRRLPVYPVKVIDEVARKSKGAIHRVVYVGKATTTAGSSSVTTTGAGHDHADSGFQPWLLESRTRVNHNSWIFHFRSAAHAAAGAVAAAGGPKPDYGDVTDSWHVTLRFTPPGSTATVLRDYTPVSDLGAHSRGELDLLIKVYPDGVMTQYLAALPDGAAVLVSEPEKTLSFPCGPGARGGTDVALVVGGTGITPAMQLIKVGLLGTDGTAFVEGS